MIALALAVVALVAPPKPGIVWKPIPFPAHRLAEMAAYSQRHYGIASYVLHPRAIVEHVTATSSFASAYNTFVHVPQGNRRCQLQKRLSVRSKRHEDVSDQVLESEAPRAHRG